MMSSFDQRRPYAYDTSELFSSTGSNAMGALNDSQTEAEYRMAGQALSTLSNEKAMEMDGATIAKLAEDQAKAQRKKENKSSFGGLGSTLGGIAGSIIGGPVGGAIGSAGGGFLGSLFG